MTVKTSAPGKLHLIGEHVVNYGIPAILSAVNKRIYAEITSRDDGMIEIISQESNTQNLFSFTQMRQIWQYSESVWKRQRQTGDTKELSSFIHKNAIYPLIALYETCNFWKISELPGLKLTISSEIPQGRGMGSSAALAVAISAACSLFLHQKLVKKKIQTIAYRIECKMHGSPSGGDTSVSSYGGLIWFTKHGARTYTKRLSVSLLKDLSSHFFIIDTGKPIESTLVMVTNVNKYITDIGQTKSQQILISQRELASELRKALTNNNYPAISEILQKAEKNLELLEVVSSSTRQVIRNCEIKGFSVKVCGAGGLRKASGILLGFYPNEMPELHLDYKTFAITLGEEGVREEYATN